jgi:hypothetical protein
MYYLDRHLALAESTRQFSDDGRGRKIPEERYYVVAIRRRGHPGWVFRFSRNHEALDSIVNTLNRPPGLLLTTSQPSQPRAAWR